MSCHLTIAERDRIAEMRHRGAEQKEIAKALGRSGSTICRELKRNGEGGAYDAAQAQEKASARRRDRPLQVKMDAPQLSSFVRKGLAQEWSPEQISGRAKQQHPHDRRRQISAQSIYTWIKRSPDRSHWRGFLRRRGKRPCRRKNSQPDAGKARIKDRPEEAEQRVRYGDWEGDTVLGPPGTGGLVTLVDRKSGYTIICKIMSKDADHVQAKIRDRLKQLDEELRRTLTFDNGTEFARCHRLEKHLGMQIYFAEPGCPYQRGSNENTNGLIRQYFPKGTDFRYVSHHEVRDVEKRLNDRPRARHGFRTPEELLYGEIKPPDCN